jgi:hypothetical protein
LKTAAPSCFRNNSRTCNICRAVELKQNYEAHKEQRQIKARENAKKWYEKNKAEKIAKVKLYYQQHKKPEVVENPQ